jgi:hypothetical protein
MAGQWPRGNVKRYLRRPSVFYRVNPSLLTIGLSYGIKSILFLAGYMLCLMFSGSISHAQTHIYR